MNWSTQGAMKGIVDNLIAGGQIQPAVIVMPNNPSRQEITAYLVPFIEDNINVSEDPADRALLGLSGGGTVVQDILFNDTTQFGYYGVWSVPRGLPTAGQENKPELKELLGLHIGVGIQDLGGLAQGNTTAEQALLTSAGVSFTSFNVDGAHTWSYWRDALRDFLTKVTFKATTVTVAHTGRAMTATVTADTTVPAAPGGTVQFSLNGVAIGDPQPVRNGVARGGDSRQVRHWRGDCRVFRQHALQREHRDGHPLGELAEGRFGSLGIETASSRRTGPRVLRT